MISSNVGGRDVVTKHLYRFTDNNTQLSHRASVTLYATARYSAFVDDLETIDYFLERNDTRLGPKNTTYPVVEREISEQPAQSASE